MYFISTRNGEKVTGAQAIAQGLAKDGGLFVPETFPVISRSEMEKMEEMSYAERAAFVLAKYFDEFDADFLKEVCETAYAKFDSSDPVPLVRVNEGLYILEQLAEKQSTPTYRNETKKFSLTIEPCLARGIIIESALRQYTDLSRKRCCRQAWMQPNYRHTNCAILRQL